MGEVTNELVYFLCTRRSKCAELGDVSLVSADEVHGRLRREEINTQTRPGHPQNGCIRPDPRQGQGRLDHKLNPTKW